MVLYLLGIKFLDDKKMKFNLVFSYTNHVKSQMLYIGNISDYLEIELADRTYGNGLFDVVFGISCGGPLSNQWQDFETGTIFRKKYTKSRKMLELTFHLNYQKVISTDNDNLGEIVKEGIMATYIEVEKLNIKDFKIHAFYNDIKTLLEDKGWIKNPEKYKKAPFEYQLEQYDNKPIPMEHKMPEDAFWELINISLIESQGVVKSQVKSLINNLTLKSEKEMIGFELTFRELVSKSYHYNVMGLLKIINGIVTDDTLLYFQCKLILCGKKVFYGVVQNPNNISDKIDSIEYSGSLLSVADMAFIKQFGENSNKELPSDIASAYIDYNIGNYPLLGMPWQDGGFAKRFAKAIKVYS